MHGRGGAEHLVYEDVPEPQPGPGQVLLRVVAAAIFVNELRWDETYLAPDGAPRPLPIPGRDLSGSVTEVGAGATGVSVGDAVYSMLGYSRDGAWAECTIALPDELAPVPRTVDSVHAAATPLSALTAWQALFEQAHLMPGQRVLIHGAAGGVGTYAVQLAHWCGAEVFATASARDDAFLRELGTDHVIDYTTIGFEDVAHDVDVVFDLVGGDTLARSFAVVKPNGVVVSVVSVPPPPEMSPRPDVRFAYFIVQPSGEQLRRIAGLIDSGYLHPLVAEVFPLAEARRAYDVAAHGHPRGKVVLTVS
jgi:NADPH:quinone reductase-like Zn-dependent oxidoreductase